MKIGIACFFCLMSLSGQSQDVAFAKEIVDTLSSPAFWGRGYTKEGMHKAAGYIEARFKSFGLQPMNGKKYLQTFHYPVNRFPDKMELEIDGKKLIPGEDYIVGPESGSMHAKGKLVQQDSTTFVDIEKRFVVLLQDKLTWSVSNQQADYCVVVLNKNKFSSAHQYRVDIDASFDPDFKAANVCGYVKGTEVPDSFILFTAHYDHLGGMGRDTYFPGANDNASGVSLLMNLARYYGTHPPRYSIGFICFAGEEAGLTGSKYYVEHPLRPLSSIRFLINSDLAGTGEDGITVVNATEFPKEFKWMQDINDSLHLLTAVKPRGKAANSDHYFFTQEGVPSFFFYTMGGIKAYHDVFDKASTLPLNEHEDLFKLIVYFNKRLMAE